MKYIALLSESILHFVLILPLAFLIRRRYGTREVMLWLYILFIVIAESLLAGGLEFTFFPGQQWNWVGKSVCFVLAALLIIRERWVTKKEAGCTWQLHPGSLRSVIIVSACLLVFRLAVKALTHEFRPPDAETMAFEATLPGLSEELIYRGLLLALFTRLYPVEKSRLGFLNRPLVLVALLFALGHGVKLDEGMHLTFNPQSLCMTFGLGCVFGWLRQRSGSVWPAVVFHNLWNVVVFV